MAETVPPIFGQNLPLKRKKVVSLVEAYDPYRISPLIEAVLKADKENWERNDIVRQDIWKSIWGEEIDSLSFPPSKAAHCPRQLGYKALGYSEAPLRLESIMTMGIGTGTHIWLLRKLGFLTPGHHEIKIFDFETPQTGKADFVFQNPITSQWQVADLKTVSQAAFNKLNRDKLPQFLRNTKNIVWPFENDLRQILLYMWILEKQGFDVGAGNIFYLNRNSGQTKEAIIPWDSQTKYQTKQYVEKLKKAREKIEKGELPEADPASEWTCQYYCDFSHHCDNGRDKAVKKKKKKRPPQWVLKQAKEERAEKEVKAEKLREAGTYQPEMPLIP